MTTLLDDATVVKILRTPFSWTGWRSLLDARLRKAVDVVWDQVWSSGITNPLAVVDYLTPLFLLKMRGSTGLTEIISRASEGDAPGSSQMLVTTMSEFGLSMPDSGIWIDTDLLASVAASVATIEVTDRHRDILGDCFEYVLSHLTTAGDFGQFRTPRHIVKFVVEAVSPHPLDVVLDPACGTGGFLIAAHEHNGGVQSRYLADESDWTMARIASANLILHGLAGAAVRRRDALTHAEAEADVILANPPFAGMVAEGRREALGAETSKSELLFLELMIRRLKPQGRAGVVVPSGTLTSTARAAAGLRKKLVEFNSLKAVIELPSGVFRPYTDVRTAVLLWERREPSKNVMMLRASQDGFSLDDRREAVPLNDLPYLLNALQFGCVDADPSRALSVTLDEIRANSYVLSPSRYLQHVGPAWGTTTSLHEALGDLTGSAEMLLSTLQRLEKIKL